MGGRLDVRAALPGDRDRVVELYRRTYPELDAAPRAAVLDGAEVVVGTAGGAVVAAGLLAPLSDEPFPGEHGASRLNVLADEDTHWQDMHAQLTGRLLRAGVRRWYVIVREDSVRVRRLLTGHSYRISSTSWGARLVVTDESLPRLRELAASAPAGVRLGELAAADAEPAWRLRADHRNDFPSSPATQAEDYPVERVRRSIVTGRAFGAWQDGRLLALTTMEHTGPGSAETDYTVTAADARGRGLATAVKAYAVCALADEGVRRFGTGGAGVNEPSRRANLRLGYQLEPTWLTYVCD